MPVSLRAATADDEEFLFLVYASTRQDEMAVVPWSEGEKESFCRMQSAAQLHHYRTHFPEAEYTIIERDGVPVGRMIVDRSGPEVRLMDVALLPVARGEGIGTRLIEELRAEAAERGVPVRLHVETFNRARDLYERLGFGAVREQGVHLEMLWPARTAAAEAAAGGAA